MVQSIRADWLAPALLIGLTALPVAAGMVRLVWLAGGLEFTHDHERFLAAPAPAVLHIASTALFCVLGALQFSPGLRMRQPQWHRAAGRLVVPCGLLAALSGLWLTQFYPPAEHDGPLLYALRLVFGSAMAAFIAFGFAAIRQRNIARHRMWMMRGYAIGAGAGTLVLLHLPWIAMFGQPDELARAGLHGAAWCINLGVAEWLLYRARSAENHFMSHRREFLNQRSC